MRFLLLVCVVFCLAGAWAQEDDDMYIEDQSGEGPLNMQRLGPSDDEDVETEGSGEPATDKADDNNIEVTPETEIVLDTRGKIKSVIEEKPDDRIEPAKEEPVKVGDDSEEDEKSVIDPATVIAGPSMQFLAAVIVGGCIGLLFAICVIMLLVYRMRKKDEGSYALDYGLDKKPQGNYEYTKGVDSKEYYA